MHILHEVGCFGATPRKASCNSQALRERNALTLEMPKVEFPNDGVFDQAVAVYGHRSGDVRNIGSAREASEWLLYEWPDGSRDSVKAREACVAAQDGGDAEVARQAFREVAAEAGVLIGDVDRVYKPCKR